MDAPGVPDAMVAADARSQPLDSQYG
jgi:hypothetical protein